jgi:hypothetical protein
MHPHKPKLALELAIRHAEKNFNFFLRPFLKKSPAAFGLLTYGMHTKIVDYQNNRISLSSKSR